jgi:hypothetical protein
VTHLLFPVSYTVSAYKTDGTQVGTPLSVPATSADPVGPVIFSGLTNGVPVYFKVTATTLVFVTSPPAQSNTITPAGPPLAPTTVTATAGDRGAIVSWPPTNDNGEPITGYELAIVNPVTGAELAVNSVAQSPYQVGGLTNGTRYAFKVRAINALGTGPYSTLSNTVIPAGPPFPPENVIATPGNTQITVSWNAPSMQGDGTPGDNGSQITTYVVEVEPGGRTLTVDGAVTSAVVTGLDNGTLYLFMVTANNAAGAPILDLRSPCRRLRRSAQATS